MVRTRAGLPPKCRRVLPQTMPMPAHPRHEPPCRGTHSRRGELVRPLAPVAQRPQAHDPRLLATVYLALLVDHRDLGERAAVVERGELLLRRPRARSDEVQP